MVVCGTVYARTLCQKKYEMITDLPDPVWPEFCTLRTRSKAVALQCKEMCKNFSENLISYFTQVFFCS